MSDIRFKYYPTISNGEWYDYMSDYENIINTLIDNIRSNANSVRVPNNIGVGGRKYEYFYVKYNSNEMKKLILSEAAKMNLVTC